MGWPGATFCTSAIICATAGLVGALSVGAVCTATNTPAADGTRYGEYWSRLVTSPRNPAARSACVRPNTFERLPTTNTASGGFPALLVRTAVATDAYSEAAGTASALLP